MSFINESIYEKQKNHAKEKIIVRFVLLKSATINYAKRKQSDVSRRLLSPTFEIVTNFSFFQKVRTFNPATYRKT